MADVDKAAVLFGEAPGRDRHGVENTNSHGIQPQNVHETFQSIRLGRCLTLRMAGARLPVAIFADVQHPTEDLTALKKCHEGPCTTQPNALLQRS